ncbi:MAG: helix-turn-helix domain-containing protein [Azospirillaceae bacterium]
MSEEGVKSARRVFEILELFAKERRELTVIEVADALGFPQSSTSALMRTMAALGYLHYDTRQRSYQPSARLPLITSWIGQHLFRQGRILRLMEDLSRATGETIILGIENGLNVRYIHVIEATGPIRLHDIAGRLRPFATSAVGLALLSTFDDATISRLIRRLNSEKARGENVVKLSDLMARVNEARDQGYVVSNGGIVPGGGAVAMVLPDLVNDHPLAIAIASIEANVNQFHQHWFALMKGAIKDNLDDARVFADPRD